MNDSTQPQVKKSKLWIWIIVVVLLIIIGFGGYYFWSQKPDKDDNSTAVKTETINEDWVVDPKIFKENTTSTDTHKLSDETYRMYLMGQGGILYADSVDGVVFDNFQATGVKEEPGKMISNPAVLQVSTNDWIMIYEMAPMKQPGQQNVKTVPGVANQRDLYLATSTDGKAFTKVGLAIDSSKNDNFFASVPDLVKTPDGKIRMYYVSGGNDIGSAISVDNGKTWVKEEGIRMSNAAVDPDVILKTENGKTSWVMYYSVLDPKENAIYKTTSTDGLKWGKGTKLFAATTQGAIVDPDVVEIPGGSYLMYLGQSSGGGSTGGEQINLYRAKLDQSIF